MGNLGKPSGAPLQPRAGSGMHPAVGGVLPRKSVGFLLESVDVVMGTLACERVLGVLKLEHARSPLVLVISDPCHRGSVARPGEASVGAEWGLEDVTESRVEPWPCARDSERGRGAFGRHCARVTLCAGGELRGALLLERDAAEPAFTHSELQKLEVQLPLLTAGIAAESSALDLTVERSATAALGSHTNMRLLIDGDTKRVVWAKRDGHSIDWASELEPLEAALANVVIEIAAGHGDTVPASPRLTPIGLVETVAPLGASTVFAGNCLAAGLRATADSSPMTLLSARERAVARLLARGYTPANIAAISGLAEHTVKTYVRRTYKKLGVSTRVELVRVLLNNFPWLGSDS